MNISTLFNFNTFDMNTFNFCTFLSAPPIERPRTLLPEAGLGHPCHYSLSLPPSPEENFASISFSVLHQVHEMHWLQQVHLVNQVQVPGAQRMVYQVTS